MTATPLNPNGAILNTATPLRPKRSELLQLRTRRMVSTRPYSLSTVRHMAAMIGRNKKRRIEGMRDLECGTRPRCAFRAAISGKTFAPGLEEPPMFKMHMIRSELQSWDLVSWPWWLWLLPFS